MTDKRRPYSSVIVDGLAQTPSRAKDKYSITVPGGILGFCSKYATLAYKLLCLI